MNSVTLAGDPQLTTASLCTVTYHSYNSSLFLQNESTCLFFTNPIKALNRLEDRIMINELLTSKCRGEGLPLASLNMIF